MLYLYIINIIKEMEWVENSGMIKKKIGDMVEKVIKREKGRSDGEETSTKMLYSKRHEEIRIKGLFS